MNVIFGTGAIGLATPLDRALADTLAGYRSGA